MRKHYLPILILILIASALLLASCNDGPVYYTVGFDLNGGTVEPSLQPLAIEEGLTIVEPKEPTREGYTFLGWYAGTVKWNFETDKIQSDVVLKAKWERITHTVTFDSDGGSAVSSQTVGDGDRLIEPATPTKPDSEFLGWYLGEVRWDFTTDIVTDDITLVAQWDTAVIVTFVTDSHSVRPTQTLELGDKAEKPHNPTREGHKFLGWYATGSDTPFDFDAQLYASVVIEARWDECETYTITFDSKGGTEVETMYVPVGELIEQPPAPEKKSCVLIWWEYYDPETEELAAWSFSTMIPESDVELIAYWSLPIHRP